jgi:hypothetical protein
VGNVIDSVRHYPFLFAPADITSRDVNYVWPFGKVRTDVDWENQTVTNTTEKGHTFEEGKVVHQIIEADIVFAGRVQRGLVVSTTGTGTMEGPSERILTWVNLAGNAMGYWSLVHSMQYRYWATNYGIPAAGR